VEKKEDFDQDPDQYPFEAISADIFGQYLLVHIVLRYCVCVYCCWRGINLQRQTRRDDGCWRNSESSLIVFTMPVHVPTSKYPQIRKPPRLNHWRHSAPISYLPISCRIFGGHQVLKPWPLGSRPLPGKVAPFLKGCARKTTYSTEQSRRGFRTFKIPQL
jgi:hypothetical protein